MTAGVVARVAFMTTGLQYLWLVSLTVLHSLALSPSRLNRFRPSEPTLTVPWRPICSISVLHSSFSVRSSS